MRISRLLLLPIGCAAIACGDASAARPSPSPPAATPETASAKAPAPVAADVTPPRSDAARPAPPAAPPWIDPRGTSIVGFGLLRVVPRGPGAATFRIRYHEFPDGYATTGNLQVFVLPADAFGTKEHAFADEFLAFARTADAAPTGTDGALRVETTFTAAAERTVIVAYGPWTAPDAGRPAGDVPTFGVEVVADGGEFEWIESEAGELITTNWTRRSEVERGGPFRDALDGTDVWIEVRPMILYDGRLARTPDEAAVSAADATETPAGLRERARALAAAGERAAAADLDERAADLEAHAVRADRRLVLTPPLAEKFRRVPIRWR